MQRGAPAAPSPLALKPAISQRRALEDLAECSQAELLEQLRELKVQRWERCVASSWHPVLNRFDNILAAFADPVQRAAEGAPDEELVCEVLRVLHDIVFLQQELKGVVDRLRDLLQCTELKVLLGALKCLAVSPPSRHLQSSPLAAAMERRLEVLACCGAPSVLGSTSFRDACSAEDYDLADFQFEIPTSSAVGTNPSELSVLKVPASIATAEPSFEELSKQFEESPMITDAIRPAVTLQLRLWCRARSLEGRQEVVAIALLAICNSIKHVGPSMLQQYLQKRPGLLSELCELLQSIQAVGPDAGVAALRVTGAILDSRFGQSRSEASQLSQMLGLSLPHGIVACALRGLLGHQPAEDKLGDHNRVLLAALDLFQITTVSNHQTTAQLGHAGMILAMLELMQKTDVASLPAVTAMLRCLELAAEVSGTAALVLFRDFSGLQAFSLRLQREVELMMALDFTGDAFELEPPGEGASREEKQRFWELLEEVTARRKLCRQLLKNIQTALQSTEVLQAGLANVFQGPLMDALKTALKEPSKVGLSLFGTAIDIVSSIIQDDPARVPQMIDSEVLPGIMAALNKDTMRSAECLSFVPGVLASIALHAVGEDFLLNSPSKPIQLLTDILVDPSFSPLLHNQPELAQIMSTQVDKVLRNRPAGPNKLTDHVVDCLLAGMRSILDQAKDYPEWTPLDLEDHTEYLADRLVCFSRFCWSILSTNEQTLKSFLEKKGLALVRELHELPCLPYHLTSLEGQQHPVAGLFNLQARGPDGNLAVAAELEDMLSSNFEKAEQMLSKCPPGSDPYVTLAAEDDAQVSAFLRSISRSAAALEGLLSVCREGSSVQVLEAVRAPLKHVGKLGGCIFALAAWYPPEVQERERNSASASYHETIKTLFTPSATSEGSSASGSSDAPPEKKEREFPMKGKLLLETARQCFRLTAHATRQLLVVVSKQLHSRARQREVSPTISGLATELAKVAKACVSGVPPNDTVANLRWTSDIFDLLLRMHEEQNRVAVRPLSLSAFYQVGGFELLEPLLQKVGQHLDVDAGPPALGSALAYLEKVTSHKRFTNAPQVGLLKVEDGFIPKDPLCRSVQAEALRIMLPVWRNADLARFPAHAAQSLMKVWVHSLDGPRDIPPRPAATPAAVAATANSATQAQAPTSGASARGPWADEATRRSMVESLTQMGFPQEQIERRLQEVDSNTRPDIASLIMLMASGDEATTSPPPAQEAESPTPAPEGPPGVKAKTATEFQDLVADMLKDLLPRILLFGRKVPKAIPVVADAMAFIVAVPTQLWDSGVGKNGPEANASSVVQACLEALGDSHEQPPADALACVAQVLASLLHRRQQVVTAIGPAGAESLLVKLNRWSLQSIDANVEPLARGYRTFCMGSAAPAPEGLGEPLLPPPAWLTPVMVCAHQLLISVDLVQLRQGRESLSNEVQKSWVTGVLDILYAFPGAEPGLALASIQLLLRLCSAQIGAHAFLEYQPRLSLDADGKLKVPSETAGGMIVLLRLARKTIFTGMLQMVADLAVTLMEEGPALQARMETEILGLFSQQVKTLPIKQIASRLNPLFIRNPDIFGEALKAVTQKAQSSDQSSIVLEPLPESERSKQKPAPHPGALVMLQTLVAEICFNLELQHSTAFPKIFDASKRPEPEDAAKPGEKGKKDEKKKEKEDKEEEKEQASKESKEEAGKEPSKLPPLFPLALDSNALLFVLDALVSRVPGMSALTMKPALPLGTNPSSMPENSLVVPDRQDKAPPKSLLLMMTRHLMPRFAQLADVWQEQIQPLSHSQRMHLTHTGAIIPMQKCMPHLATTLASTARLCVEPRRALASEVVLSTKALAETEKSEKSQSLSFSTEVAAVCGLVARLLGAAAAADRKEDKEDEEAQSRPGTSDAKDSQRKAKGKKESSVFCNQSETQALRESLVAILLRTDLQCTVVMAVATGIVKCLEFLTRRETKKSGAQGPLPEPEEAVVPSAAEFAVEFSVPDGAAHDELDRDEDEEDDEEEEDDDDLAEEEDEEAMAGIDGGHLPEHEDFADDDYDAEFDEDYGEDDAMDFEREGDDMLHGDDGAEPNLATILNNAIHVIDQQVQGFNPDQMTMQMNFSPDLGDGPPRRAPPRAGRGAMDFLGVTVGTGWSEPGDLDLPGEHPMLRREHQSHAQPLQQMPQLAGFQMPGASGVVDMSRMVQLVPGPDAFRQIFAGSGPTGGAAGIIGGPGGAQIVITSSSNLLPPGSAGMGGAAGALPPTGGRGGGALAAAAAESLDMAYGELAGRLSDELRTAPAESKEAPATEASEQAPAPEAPAAEPPVETTPTTAAEGEAALEHPPAADVPEPVPAADVVDEASELLARLNAEEAAEQVQAADAEPQAEEPAEGGEAHAAEAVPAEEDPAAALGIAELERLASSLGCTQTALLQAAEIDASVVAELPEDMRGAVVMATLSQVNVDHLRARNSPAPGPGAPPESGGFDEIDASVLEALPPEIREEVMREEERRRREQERAQRAAETAAAQTPQAPAGAGVGMSGDMDNASFIASLDPMLREEVLMTAPEEVLQTLPAELVAEAQMIRDRAFMRIASHREGPPPAQPPPPARAPRVQPQPSARPHQYLQAMEQQLSQLAGGRRAWLHGTDGRFRQASDDFMAQLGLALGGSRSRQAAPLVAATNAGVGTPGLASFDEADRALLERLADYDEDACQGLDPPLPPAAIPNVCQLLYLRHEVTVTPLTRLFFNLSLHPATRQFTMGQFLVLLCKEPQAVGCREPSLPPAHLYEGLENGQLPISNSTEVKAVGAQRVLQILAYLLRRVPQCGEFFAKPLQKESWLEGEAPLVSGGHLSSLVGHHSVNVLLRLLTTKLFLVSSRHAAWLLAILHALLVPVKDKKPEKPDDSPAEKEQASGSPDTPGDDEEGKVKKEVPAEQQILERWSSINKNMHAVLSQESVLALCHFLCQAGSGHGSSGEADTFQMAGEILVALAASQEHLTMVRADLMRVLADLVTNIEADLAKCEPGSTEPSTMETRLLRLVRTLAEVFKEAAKASPDQELKIEDFLREARLEDLWTSLDQTLDRLHDTEVFATPAQRILSTGVAPSQLRIESSGSTNMSGTLPSNVQTTPPKPLLNRLLPLIEAFFVLHNGSKEADMEAKERQKDHEQEGGSSSSCPGKQVFADLIEVTLVERSRFGQFCKQHRRPLNALIKQTPSLLSKSFSSVLKHMPHCLDFDNKRAYFRSQLRSRRMESRYETIRLRVRRSEIFMDSYHQLRSRTGEEMRAKIQVQFQGEEGIDAGGVGKEWYGALAKEIFNPNYALFVQAGGKACTYHPNPMSYVTRDHLDFFHFIGRVIGKAIHDAQNLEAWFTRGFYKHMLGKKVIAADLEAFDPEYFSNLKWMLEHDITDIVELYFCAESDDFGQIKVVDLKPNGRSIPVTNDNKYEYIQLMSEHKMTNSVRQQIDAFLKGLHEIVPPELLSLFDDKELELLISGLPDIDIDDLKANTEYHNYTAQSDQIQWFWKVLSEFSQEQRAWFLQFATGTSRVPVEGFKGLVGMRGPQKFCIHRAYGPDRLPSAHTCFNQLDLPDYPSEDVLREKLLQAVHEGHEGFGFA